VTETIEKKERRGDRWGKAGRDVKVFGERGSVGVVGGVEGDGGCRKWKSRSSESDYSKEERRNTCLQLRVWTGASSDFYFLSHSMLSAGKGLEHTDPSSDNIPPYNSERNWQLLSTWIE